MNLKTFYIFRHGETYFSKNGLPYGENEHTATILPESLPSIKKIAAFLNKEEIGISLRSEFLRCEQTSKVIEENSDLRFTSTKLLNEFTEKDFDTFYKRMEELVEYLLSLKEQNIAICTHGAVIAALQKLLLQKEFKAHDLMYYPKTGVVLKIATGNIKEFDFKF